MDPEFPSTFNYPLNRLSHCVVVPITPPRWLPSQRSKGSTKASNPFPKSLEQEMEIGYPTDVKHVAHVGWDGHSGAAPSWMNEFKTDPGFTAAAFDFGQPMGSQPATDMIRNLSSKDLSNVRKKQTWKKNPKSSSKSSRKSLYTQLCSSAEHEI